MHLFTFSFFLLFKFSSYLYHTIDCLFLNVHHRFAQLFKLRKLDISRNLLENLPSDISKLPAMETLIVNRNKLTSFPQDMNNLSNLRILDASYNFITIIGNIFEKLNNLEELNLRNNDTLKIESMGPRAMRLFDKVSILVMM